jgi:hypothetical protein
MATLGHGGPTSPPLILLTKCNGLIFVRPSMLNTC